MNVKKNHDLWCNTVCPLNTGAECLEFEKPEIHNRVVGMSVGYMTKCNLNAYNILTRKIWGSLDYAVQNTDSAKHTIAQRY